MSQCSSQAVLSVMNEVDPAYGPLVRGNAVECEYTDGCPSISSIWLTYCWEDPDRWLCPLLRDGVPPNQYKDTTNPDHHSGIPRSYMQIRQATEWGYFIIQSCGRAHRRASPASIGYRHYVRNKCRAIHGWCA